MKKTLLVVAVLLLSASLNAQHEHHQEQKPRDTKPKKEEATTKDKKMDHDKMSHDTDSTQTPPMSHAYSLNLPMNRNGSGTAWLPDASPMYGYMLHSKKWMYMIHGNIFIRYNNQDIGNKGVRGDTKVDAPNWFMAMGQRKVGQKGLFHFNAMFSLDPIFGGDGYPLLFQTGEAYNGKPLIDRQHPHDLFSELSVAYTQSFTKNFDAFVYFGYPGEPALGPVAFMHRPSTLNNPDATLGHHWSDATHITFGVATLGFRYKIFKIDGSLFTGREPNEERYDFDEPRFDSYSYRLTVNPCRTLSMQVSKAFINSPEELEPDEDIDRTTASVTHVSAMTGENHFLTSTFVWGYNDSGPDHKENSFTLESNLQLDRLAVYGKYENIDKSAGELVLNEFEENKIFNISALTLGVNYTMLRQLKTNFAIGAQGSVFMADAALDPIYGENPISAEVYLRISPTLMNMNNMTMKMK
jgi:hypothetical protein